MDGGDRRGSRGGRRWSARVAGGRRGVAGGRRGQAKPGLGSMDLIGTGSGCSGTRGGWDGWLTVGRQWKGLERVGLGWVGVGGSKGCVGSKVGG